MGAPEALVEAESKPQLAPTQLEHERDHDTPLLRLSLVTVAVTD